MSRDEWFIQYYFSGPDLRYNGRIVEIKSGEVPSFIDGLNANWERFEELRGKIPEDGDFSVLGECNMMIRVGGFAEGVCIRGYNGAMASREEIEATVQTFRYAIERAAAVQQMLSELDPEGCA